MRSQDRAEGSTKSGSSRYTIESDDDNVTDCHGAELTGFCPAHAAWGDHVRYEILWTVWDNVKGAHASGTPYEFRTRREAAKWLRKHVTRDAPSSPERRRFAS